MKKQVVLAILLIACSLSVRGESLDSLIANGERYFDKGQFQQADSCLSLATERIGQDTPYHLAFSYYLNYGFLHLKNWDFQKARPLLEKAYALAAERDDKLNMVNALSAQATYHTLHGELRESIKLQEKAKDIAIQADSSKYYALLSNLGIAYSNLGMSDWALKYYLEARNYFSRQNEWNSLAHVENNIGELYRKSFKNYDLAERHLRAAVAINKQANHLPKLAMNYHNLAITFQNREICDSAYYYIDRSLDLREKSGARGRLATSHTVKGDVYLCKKEFDLAIKQYNRAIAICTEYNVVPGFFYANHGLAEAYLEKGNYEKAIQKAKEALEAASNMDSPYLIAEAHHHLYEIYKADSDPTHALVHLERGTFLADSLRESRDQNILNDTRARYESDLAKALAEKEKLKEVAEGFKVDYQKLWNIGSAITIALVLVILTLILKAYLGNKQQLKEEKLLRTNLEESNKKITSQAEELKKVDSLKTAIFSVLGHDLRAPLSSISSLVQLLGDKAISSEEFEEISEDLNERTNVSLKSLDVILQWSQLSSGRGTPEIEELSVEPIIDDILNLNKHQIQNKGLIVTKQFNPKIKLSADPNQFRSIAMNLISNALKYSPDGEILTIGTTQTEREVEFFVKDMGKGFPSETISLLQSNTDNKIISKVGTKGEKGTGIGLKIVKDFVHAHGAHLKITNLPKGAEVRVCFPKHSQLLEVV